MSDYKGPLGKFINGDLSKEEFISLLKAGAEKGRSKGKVPEKKSLSLGEDGSGEVDELGYANWVGDISDEEYEEFYNAMS